MTRLKFSKSLLIALLVAAILFSNIVAFVTDWWWFSEVGYTQIFITSLSAKLALFLAAGIAAAAFLFINFSVAIRSFLPTDTGWTAMLPEALIGRRVQVGHVLARKLAAAFSAVVALFFGLVAAANWEEALKFIYGGTFGAHDPIFNKDIGFYVFSYPVLHTGLGLAKTLVMFTLIGCVFIYFLRGSFRIGRTARSISIFASNRARAHLGFVLILLLAIVAAGAYVSRLALLFSQSGPVFGATYADAMVRMPMLMIVMVTAAFMAAGVMYWMWTGKFRLLMGTAILYVLAGFASTAVPSLAQKLVVAPNELVKETPFIEHNIAATRRAFALDTIEEREIAGDTPITSADIAANDLTVKNVRLWDRKPLLSTFSQIQEIRTYYEFAEVDNDRYIIDGEIRQIMLSPRELASASLPNRNWINERLTFTHGYGVAAGPVNQVTPEGLPVLFVKDLPPKSDVRELEISRPEIYFGELSNDYVITKTNSREFDYPKGEENVYATYEGKGGVEINSLLRRVFYAVKFQSLKLLLSNDVTKGSRILYNRAIGERVSKIAPFLSYDRDPYIVIADLQDGKAGGGIHWIADAYTMSGLYPYAQPLRINGKNINYMRNSVKVVVNAYDGSVVFYLADAEDPIIQAYAAIFPGVFRPMSELPKVLIPHLRYPEEIFTVQTAMYAIYHMDDPQIFYNKEDQWEIPAIAQEGGGERGSAVSPMSPRHIIMKLPGEKGEEYVLMLPFTPRAKDNLSAWMVARSDGDHYGTLLAYRFPKDKLVFGPKQIIGRINQDPVISQQISLWSQGGSQVIQGPLLVIPIEESLLYVRPLYLKAEAGKIPELKRVVVAYENKIAMAETLEQGLSKIFGAGADGLIKQNISNGAKETKPLFENDQERWRRAAAAYEEALSALRGGDWTRYGDAIRRLGDILKQ